MVEYISRKLNIVLNGEEYRFINWLAEKNGISFYEQASNMFREKLEESMHLYLGGDDE